MQFRLGEPAVPEERFRRSLDFILGRTILCSVSTVGPSGAAYVNTAYFAYSPELELYFMSDPLSHHARNLRRNPSCAVAVYDSHLSWGKADRGVQLFGRCSEAKAGVVLKATEAYSQRFPRFKAWGEGLAPDATARRWKFFEFVPSFVKILDEVTFKDRGFVTASVIR